MILMPALSVIIIGLFNTFKNRIIASIIIIGLLPFFSDKKNRFISSLIIVSFVLVSYPIEKAFFKTGRVVEIRNNYYLLSNGIDKVILYTTENLSLDDKVIVNQEVKEINYYNNFNFSTYKDYCLANNIIGSVSLKEVKIKRAEFSIRKMIYDKCLNSSNKWVLQILFKNSMEIDSDKKYFITQSSLHISFFVSFLTSILSLFFYDKITNRIVFILVFLLGLFFNFPYGYIRILIGLALLNIIEDKRKRLAYEILLLAFYKPYYIKSISFLIPVGIKIISCFIKEKRQILIYIYIMIIQLYFYGQADLFSILSFVFLKSIFGLVYLLALAVCFLPIDINIDDLLLSFLEKIDNIPKLCLTGSFNLILLLTMIVLAVKYFESIKNRYLLGLILVLIVNNNRLLFSPIYTVTF